MTHLRVRKASLVATAATQRLQMVQDVASAGKAARDRVRSGVVRARSWGRTASVAMVLMAALATVRRSRRSRRAPPFTPRPETTEPSKTGLPPTVSILAQALPILRVLLSVWLEQRVSHSRRSP